MYNHTNVPPYISNLTLPLDLQIKKIEVEFAVYYKRFFLRLVNHESSLITKLNTLTLPENHRR